tara:strand:- start:218 stop:421 length:204 start_codon:yes stop_codon:yes gene_type:complete
MIHNKHKGTRKFIVESRHKIIEGKIWRTKRSNLDIDEFAEQQFSDPYNRALAVYTGGAYRPNPNLEQ